MPRLTITGRAIVVRERQRIVEFTNLGVDLVAAGWSSKMRLSLLAPSGGSPTVKTLSIVSGDNYSAQLDNTISTFTELGIWMAEIYVDDGNPDPERSTGLFEMNVIQ